jgi:uncharacterized protein YkwD
MRVRLRRAQRLVAALLTACLASHAAAAQEPSAFEREILDQTNRARTDPAGFARDLEQLLPHFDGYVLRRPGQSVGLRTNEGQAAVQEAIRFLRAQEPLPPLTWEDGLWRAAGDHVRDQGPRGSTGHTGNDGSSMGQRMSRYGRWQSTAAENIDYGSANALDVLISLIVDDGVPSRGHRTNIFNARLRVMGAACGPHARFRMMCVVNYAGGYVAAGAQDGNPEQGLGDSSAVVRDAVLHLQSSIGERDVREVDDRGQVPGDARQPERRQGGGPFEP